VNLSLSRSDEVPLDWLAGVTDTLEKICRSLDPDGAAVNLVVVDDEFIRDINARFRGQDKPTDVISFSYLNDETRTDGDELVGEVYVSHETVAREADEMGVDVAHLFLRMGVHGFLHVLGHEHDTGDGALRMERQERNILDTHLGADASSALF
jgi:probable rRNA maturation factor